MNKPPQEQLDKYHKGASIQLLFTHNSRNRDLNETFSVKNVYNLTNSHVKQISPFMEKREAKI